MNLVTVICVLATAAVLWFFRYDILLRIADQAIAGDALEAAKEAIDHWKRWEEHGLDGQRVQAMEKLEQAIGLAVAARMGGYDAIKYHLSEDKGATAMFESYDALPAKA